jgi:hypothetical protein
MFVEDREDVFGLDAGIIMNGKVWEASGHVSGFNDPLVEDLKTKITAVINCSSWQGATATKSKNTLQEYHIGMIDLKLELLNEMKNDITHKLESALEEISPNWRTCKLDVQAANLMLNQIENKLKEFDFSHLKTIFILMLQMETCGLCGRTMPSSDMFSVSNMGKKSFECKDEAICRNVAEKTRKERAIKAKADRSAAFREKFGVNIEDLVELMPRLRDASVHYYDSVYDRIFTQKLWDNDGEMEINNSAQLRAIYKIVKN